MLDVVPESGRTRHESQHGIVQFLVGARIKSAHDGNVLILN
jgi:hypothetical protein